jgi:transposase
MNIKKETLALFFNLDHKRAIVEGITYQPPEYDPDEPGGEWTDDGYDEYYNGQFIVSVRPKVGQLHRCPICGKKCPGYDGGRVRRWRGLDVGEIKVYLESPTERVECKEHGVIVAAVPWARHKSRETITFENTVAWLAMGMTKQATSELMRVAWPTVGDIVDRVYEELESQRGKKYEGVRSIGIDETSYRKNHKYMTVVVDNDKGTLLWASPGYGKGVLEKFLGELTDDEKAGIESYSADGARWISETMEEHCPKAVRCLDTFHAVKWVNEALDEVRKEAMRQAKQRADAGEKIRPRRGRPKKNVEPDKSEAADAAAAASCAPVEGPPEPVEQEAAECAMPAAEASQSSQGAAEQPAGALGSHSSQPPQEAAECAMPAAEASQSSQGAAEQPAGAWDNPSSLTPQEAAQLNNFMKGSKYACLKNPENLTENQAAQLEIMAKFSPTLHRAYLMKELFRAIFHLSFNKAQETLDDWLSWAKRCRIPSFVKLHEKISRHYDAILATVKLGLTNARVEAINNKIKVTSRMAYGFRNMKNMISMLMLRCSGLEVPLRKRAS